MILFRPVGLMELELIAASGFERFPPRLEHQPIFYPVLSADYAIEIAREWNVRDPASGYCGFVVEFDVDDAFLFSYEPHTVGAGHHQELWIPAEDVAVMNQNIRGVINVRHAFTGEQFHGSIDPGTKLPSTIKASPKAV